MPRFLLMFVLMFFAGDGVLWSYPLTEEQHERLERFLPNAFEKLQRRYPVHIALVGDDISRMETPDEESGNVLLSLHAQFARGLEAEFFYPGGVRVINPVGNHPHKLNDHFGTELTMEHFTQSGGTSLNALQRLTTDALLNDPDIVLLHFGVNDLLEGVGVDTYRKVLIDAVEICRQNGADPIIVGPTLIRPAPAPPAWGATRLYAAAAREAAEASGTMFLDPGPALARMTGEPADGDTRGKALSLSESLEHQLFDFGPDMLGRKLLNPRAHEQAGRGIFDQFLNGGTEGEYKLTATAEYIGKASLEVKLTIENLTDEPRQTLLTALNVGTSLAPAEPFHLVELEPGGSQTFPVVYERIKKDAGEDYVPLQHNSAELPVSALIADRDKTHLIEALAPLNPATVVWDLGSREDKKGEFSLEFQLRNPAGTVSKGSYELLYSSQRAEGKSNLKPGDAKGFAAQCRLPSDPDQYRLKHPVTLKVSAGSSAFVFEREIEAVRAFGLGQEMPMVPASAYDAEKNEAEDNRSILMKASADETALTVEFTLENVDFQEAEQMASLELELSLDARPQNQCRSLGFVAPVKITLGPEDGPGRTGPIVPAAFGNGYDKKLEPLGITSELRTLDGDERRRVTVIIPRVYLYRHPWNSGELTPVLGIDARLRFLRMDRESGKFGYPRESEWILSDPGLHSNDARGLSTLHMKERKMETWSVRVY